MTSTFIVQTDEHADEITGDLIETGEFEVREVFANGDSEAITCCVSEYEAISEAKRLNDRYSPEAIRKAAADAQRRADMTPSTYAGNLTPAQQETRRRFAAVAVALADDGFDIDAPANAHIGELLESWATAWAEASK